MAFPSLDLLKAHRQELLRFGPIIAVQCGWWIWALLDPETRLGRFDDPTPYVGEYYLMTCTMVFGSMVAGATSEGGGAVAFPVMTLALGVPPLVARDFSFAIQSFGMTCASVTIFGLQVPIDHEALIYCSFGGAIGLVSGLVGVSPFLPPVYAKILFVSIWLTFALSLFLLNSMNGRDRLVHQSARDSDIALSRGHENDEGGSSTADGDCDNEAIREEACDKNKSVEAAEGLTRSRRRCMILFMTGLIGGLFSSFAGSGIDIATFSILTLFFRVSEKVATPTSVVIMALNAVIGMLCRLGELGESYGPGQADAVWKFVSVCVPVVVIGAPLGAMISTRYVPRHWLAYLIYVLDTLQFVSALWIIQPWNRSDAVVICTICGATLLAGSCFFIFISWCGKERGEKVVG